MESDGEKDGCIRQTRADGGGSVTVNKIKMEKCWGTNWKDGGSVVSD